MAEFPYPYICQYCGKHCTHTKNKNARFCDKTCYKAYLALDKAIKTCLHCGESFEVSTKNKREMELMFCSPKCSNRYNQQPDPSKKTVNTCPNCAKEFEEWAYRKREFCSKQCVADFYRKPDKYISRVCVICNKEYIAGRTLKDGTESYCCSMACVHEKNSARMIGKGNPNYRSGTKYRNRGKSWSKQKNAALRRDHHKCQVCGKEVTKSRWDYGVHHIVPYHTFNGDHKTANQLSNLITLCTQCHEKVEHGKIPCPIPIE